ncbi:MAG: hypothetical protein AAB676_07255 [Verrucomicrobiota bacterium]
MHGKSILGIVLVRLAVFVFEDEEDDENEDEQTVPNSRTHFMARLGRPMP